MYVKEIREIIHDDYKIRQAERQLLTLGELTATEVINPCHAQVFFRRVGKFELNEDTLMTVEHGSILHDWITEHLASKGLGRYSVRKELVYNLTIANILIRGHPDVIDLDNSAIVELKTINPVGMAFVKMRGEPHLDHLLQVELYMFMIHSRTGRKFSGSIVYISRAKGYYKGVEVKDLEMLEFDIKDYEPKHIGFLQGKAKILSDQLRKSIEENRMYAEGVVETTRNSYSRVFGVEDTEYLWKCRFCEYNIVCPWYTRYREEGLL